MYPLKYANRENWRAFWTFPLIQPAYGEQMNTHGRRRDQDKYPRELNDAVGVAEFDAFLMPCLHSQPCAKLGVFFSSSQTPTEVDIVSKCFTHVVAFSPLQLVFAEVASIVRFQALSSPDKVDSS